MIFNRSNIDIFCPTHDKKITHVSLVNSFTTKNDVLLCVECYAAANKIDRKILPFQEISNFIKNFSSSKIEDFYSYAIDLEKFRETFDKQGHRDIKKIKETTDDEFNKLQMNLLRELEKLKIYVTKIIDEMKKQLNSSITGNDLYLNTYNYIKNNGEYLKQFKEELSKCETYEHYQQYYSTLNPSKILQLYYMESEKKKRELRNNFLRYEEASSNFFTILNVELDKFIKNSNLNIKLVNNTSGQINKPNIAFSQNVGTNSATGKESSVSYFNESSYFATSNNQTSNFKVSQMQCIDNSKILFIKNNTLNACTLQFETHFPYTTDSKISTKKFTNFKLYTSFEAMEIVCLTPHQDDNSPFQLYHVKNNEMKKIPFSNIVDNSKNDKSTEMLAIRFLCDKKPISCRRIKSIEQYEKSIDQKYWTLIFAKSIRITTKAASSSPSNISNVTLQHKIELWKVDLDLSKGSAYAALKEISKIGSIDIFITFEGNYLYFDSLKNLLFVANSSGTQITAFLFDDDEKQLKQLDDMSFQAFSNICAKIIKIDRLEADTYYILLAGTNEDYLWIYKYDDRSQSFRIFKREDLKRRIRLAFNFNADKIGFVVKLGEENHNISYFNWRNSTWDKAEKNVSHIIDDMCYLEDDRVLVYAKYGEINTINLLNKENNSKIK